MECTANPGRDESCLQRRLREKLALTRLIGKSPAFLREVEKIPRLADCDVGILIRGETGTGKEVVARAVHYLSPRSKGPFVPVNCGAIPQDLVENELFGHERGAFTGAVQPRPGLVEEAEGGTLLLDEVDSLPLLAQVKLLRFLQEKEYRRLGSAKVRTSDVRILAATNDDVETSVREGRLRQDLFYRLNVVPLTLPPLRERREDVPLLAQYFLQRYTRQYGRRLEGFADDAMEALVEYDWPGNVRELEHVVQRAVVLAGTGPRVSRTDFVLPRQTGAVSFQEAKARVVASFERSYIERMLTLHRGNVTRAAQAAQKNRRAFWELVRKHKIDVGRFRAPSAISAA